MKEIAEVYEHGTGRLIDTYEVEVPEPEIVRDLAAEIDALKVEVDKLKEIMNG